MKSGRIEALDSLRGLASLQVVIYHLIFGFPFLHHLLNGHTGYVTHSPLSFFWNGASAVVLFFVLSGFVLSIPHYAGKQPLYMRFLIKRVIRLYIPCFAIITVALLFSSFFHVPANTAGYEDWLSYTWSSAMSFADIAEVYLLIPSYYGNVDAALWTLPIEIKLSLLLPPFVWLLEKGNIWTGIVLILCFILFYHAFIPIGLGISSQFAILYYFTFFLLGALLSKYKEKYISWFNSLGAVYFYMLLLVSVLLYCIADICWYFPESAFTLRLIKTKEYFAGFSALLLIGFALSDRFKKVMLSPFLLWLGRISFSLYLTHIVTIAALASLLSPFLNMYLIFSFAVPAAFLFSIVFYKWVEMPSLRLANKASSYFAPKRNDNIT